MTKRSVDCGKTMNDDPVEVIEAMAMRAAVARRVGEAELRCLRERRDVDPLAHARAEVRVRLAIAAAAMGRRWLRQLQAEGRVDAAHGAALDALLGRVLEGACHPSGVMDPELGPSCCRPNTVTSVGSSPRADFGATAHADADRT